MTPAAFLVGFFLSLIIVGAAWLFIRWLVRRDRRRFTFVTLTQSKLRRCFFCAAPLDDRDGWLLGGGGVDVCPDCDRHDSPARRAGVVEDVCLCNACRVQCRCVRCACRDITDDLRGHCPCCPEFSIIMEGGSNA